MSFPDVFSSNHGLCMRRGLHRMSSLNFYSTASEAPGSNTLSISARGIKATGFPSSLMERARAKSIDAALECIKLQQELRALAFLEENQMLHMEKNNLMEKATGEIQKLLEDLRVVKLSLATAVAERDAIKAISENRMNSLSKYADLEERVADAEICLAISEAEKQCAEESKLKVISSAKQAVGTLLGKKVEECKELQTKLCCTQDALALALTERSKLEAEMKMRLQFLENKLQQYEMFFKEKEHNSRRLGTLSGKEHGEANAVHFTLSHLGKNRAKSSEHHEQMEKLYRRRETSKHVS